MGSWVHYGLGSGNEDLPSFIVLVSKNAGGQPLYARLWGNAFLPAYTQGVQFRSGKDPVLFLKDPEGFDRSDRRRMLAYLERLHEIQLAQSPNPDLAAQISQYEMAFRMQMSVPEAVDMSNEPDWVFDLYGEDSRDPGTYAANCLLARRLAERGVKFHPIVSPGVGPTWGSTPWHSPPVQKYRSGYSRFGKRPQATWSVGRYPGNLGRGIWSNQLQPGKTRTQQLWSRSSPPML